MAKRDGRMRWTAVLAYTVYGVLVFLLGLVLTFPVGEVLGRLTDLAEARSGWRLEVRDSGWAFPTGLSAGTLNGTGPKGDLIAPYEATPDFSQELDQYEVLEYALEPGDCLIFDALTMHGAPNPVPPQRGVRRFTLRLADGAATYRRRGPWTLEMTEYLERECDLIEGGPYACDLLPILWTDEHTKQVA